MTLLSFVIFTICLAKQCTSMETGIDTKNIQNRGMHTTYTVSIQHLFIEKLL